LPMSERNTSDGPRYSTQGCEGVGLARFTPGGLPQGATSLPVAACAANSDCGLPWRAASLPAAPCAAILAGGLGTRLRAAVADRPKVMADVGGRPFLARWLDFLEAQGVREVVVCTGYRGRQIEECFGGTHGRLRLTYSPERDPLGTGGALRHALALLHGRDILVLNGDSFCEIDLEAHLAAHASRHARASLLLTRVEDTRRFGRVILDRKDRVIEFREKAAASGPGWINAGVYLLRRELLAALPAARPLSLEHDLLPRWMSSGVYGFAANGRFIDIGTPESYALAEDFFAGLPGVAA